MDTRKHFVTELGQHKITHIQTPFSEDFGRQAPTGIQVIGRIRKLLKNDKLNKREAFSVVATELTII